MTEPKRPSPSDSPDVEVTTAELRLAMFNLHQGETAVGAGPTLVDNGKTQQLDLKQHAELMALRAQQTMAVQDRLERQVVVMFTDLVGSTAYYEKYGDMKGREKVLTHNALLFPLIQGSAGVIVKTIGDAIMAYFSEAKDALKAAAHMQHTLADYNRPVKNADEQIHIRVALHGGQAIVQDGDLFGDVVNVAARIEHAAQGDEVLVSESIATGNPSWPFEQAGTGNFKGKSEAMQLYRLRWKEIERNEQTERPEVPARYVIQKLLARGALGHVFLADDTETKLPVTVKGLHDFIAEDEAARQAFVQSGADTQKLQHPAVVRVLAWAETSAPRLYHISEYIEGRSLGAFVTKYGALPPAQAAMIVANLGEIVQSAQAQGVLHGGMSPGSVIITSKGELKLTGFGMSAVNATLVRRGRNPVGEPAYIAPEQILSGKVDVRTDVYSLGTLLYFLLSGRAPYGESASLQGTRVVASGGYEPLQQVNPNVPEELAQISARAMSLLPAGRFADVEALLQPLRAYFDINNLDPQKDVTPFLLAPPQKLKAEKSEPKKPAAMPGTSSKAGMGREIRPRPRRDTVPPAPSLQGFADKRYSLALGTLVALIIFLIMAGAAGGYFLGMASVARDERTLGARIEQAVRKAEQQWVLRQQALDQATAPQPAPPAEMAPPPPPVEEPKKAKLKAKKKAKAGEAAEPTDQP